MRSIKAVLGTLAVMALAGSAMAVQNQVIWVSDNGTALVGSPSASTSGAITFSGSDAFWTVVISTGTAYPPLVGPGTLSSPVMDLSITATEIGDSSATHALTITFGADGFGPTAGAFAAILSGHVVSGAGGQTVTYNSYYTGSPLNPASVTPPAGTLLTASGPVAPSVYNSTVSSAGVSLAAPYALEEVVTIGSSPDGASYSLDASLRTVPDGGTTAMLLGGALSVLGLIRRKLA